ncbi:MAG TPA: hypothetical protein PLC54_00770, partial [Spirochaetales bacterium]|nr:hypothetical protein [Spirochaetales bacterium]
MYQNDLIYTIDSHSQSDAARRPLPSPSLGFLYRARYGSSGIPVLVRASEPGVPAGFMARRLETHYRAALAAGSSATPSPLYLGPYENGIILVTEDRIEETMAAAMRSGPMQYTEAARWISGCIRSLKALHRGGWIHCSLRPDHIGMDRDGTVLLLGLGSARQVRDVSGEPLDLPDDTYKLGFLTPEQTGRLDRPMDWRTDIFSLGAIMYAALSGKPPFGGQDAPTVLHECIASIPPSLSALRDDIPQFVSDIVSRAMNKNPDRRYRTLSGLQHDMDAVLSGTFSGMQAGQKDHPEDLLAIDGPGQELQFGTMLQWIQETFPDLVPAREQLAGMLVAAGVQDSDSLHSYMHKLLAAGDIAYDDPRGAWFFVRPNASGAQSDAALQALLPARLALVDEDTQRFLECASCAGDEFDWQSIAALVRQEAADRILVQAVSAGLIIPSSRGGFSYRFSHPALRKSLYERLESIRKSVWHSAFAERYSSAGRLDLVIPHVLADPLKPRRRDEVIRRAAMFMEAGIALRPHDAEQALLLVSKARTMLGPAGWRDAYRLRLDVCMLFASLCAATGRAAEFDDCAGQMRAEARASNLPAVHRVLILAHSALGRSEEAVAEGRAALRQMGWPMPANPAPLGALVAYLFARSINAINAKLPKPNKPASMKKKIHEALETVLNTGTSAYVSKPT